MKRVLAIAYVALMAPAAHGQTFPSQTANLPVNFRGGEPFSQTSVPVDPNSYIFLTAPKPTDAIPEGESLIDYGAIPLSAFAGSADVAALRSEMATTRHQIRSRIARGSALASATDLQGPSAGASSRVGGQLTTYNGEVAGGVNFVHQFDQVDVGGAVGIAKASALGKISAGFNW